MTWERARLAEALGEYAVLVSSWKPLSAWTDGHSLVTVAAWLDPLLTSPKGRPPRDLHWRYAGVEHHAPQKQWYELRFGLPGRLGADAKPFPPEILSWVEQIDKEGPWPPTT